MVRGTSHCVPKSVSEPFMDQVDLTTIGTLTEPRVTVRQIAIEVCSHTGNSVHAVFGRSRAAHVCRVRELVCYIAHRRGLTLSQIGRALRRDHSTIKHAIDNEVRRRAEEST